jgi:hypothetical protein
MDLSALKEFMQSNGIEAAFFYGEDAFYLPVHQNLNNDHIEFMLRWSNILSIILL